MADAPAPSQEQVTAANEAELARWQDDFSEEELNVPTSSEEVDAKGTDEESAEETAEVEAADDIEEAEELEEIPSLVTTADPGDYTPADYSFEVTLANGKTVTVKTPEQADEIADDSDNFETPKQLMQFITKSNKMQRNLDRDFEKWESQKKTYDEQVAQQQERDQVVQSLAAGFEYLIAKGMMPAIDPADANADWADPEVAKHPGVKEQVALINYMTKENAQREKAGIPLLSSALDAFNAWQLDTGRQAAEAEHRAAGEARRAAGARVAGVSASAQAPFVPKGISVGRVIPMRGGANWED